MPIVVHRREKTTVAERSGRGFVPGIRCGECGETIEHARHGEVQWSRQAEPGRHVVFLHGSCAEDYRRFHEGRHGSMGLGQFIRRLGDALGVTID